MARHTVTIADVARVHRAVSCMGTADLRDAALAAAPHAASQGASKEDVARIAAALIVRATNGDPAAFGLPELTDEQLERAAAAVPRPTLRSDVAPDEAEREIGFLRADIADLRTRLRRAESERDALAPLRDELAATERERLRLAGDLVAAQDQLAAVRAENADLYAERAEKARERHALEDQLAAERTATEAVTRERDELREKLAACEASLGEVSEQLAAAQAAPKKR